MKKLIVGLICLFCGFAAVVIGFSGIFVSNSHKPISDAEVIERAKDLGMVEVNELIDTETK